MSLIYAPVSSSHSTSYTGSISKILSLGGDDVENTLERIEFGVFTTPETAFTASSIVDSIVIPAGTYVEGPIGRVKVSASSDFLIYFNQ
tara:strand:- start:57 stop:323 length:267 start_codon:yes stop_codon:yes gene_type:complete